MENLINEINNLRSLVNENDQQINTFMDFKKLMNDTIVPTIEEIKTYGDYMKKYKLSNNDIKTSLYKLITLERQLLNSYINKEIIEYIYILDDLIDTNVNDFFIENFNISHDEILNIINAVTPGIRGFILDEISNVKKELLPHLEILSLLDEILILNEKIIDARKMHHENGNNILFTLSYGRMEYASELLEKLWLLVQYKLNGIDDVITYVFDMYNFDYSTIEAQIF